MGRTDDKSADLLQGTLDLLILKAVTQGEKHGYEIAEWIHSTSDEALSVEEGALYPALHRLEPRDAILFRPLQVPETSRVVRISGVRHSSADDLFISNRDFEVVW